MRVLVTVAINTFFPDLPNSHAIAASPAAEEDVRFLADVCDGIVHSLADIGVYDNHLYGNVIELKFVCEPFVLSIADFNITIDIPDTLSNPKREWSPFHHSLDEYYSQIRSTRNMTASVTLRTQTDVIGDYIFSR